MSWRAASALALACVLVGACGGERASGPRPSAEPATHPEAAPSPAPDAAPALAASAPAPALPPAPVVDVLPVDGPGLSSGVVTDPCDWVLVAVVEGDAITATMRSGAARERVILPRDASAVFSWTPSLTLTGKGRVVVARVRREACSHDDLPAPHVEVVGPGAKPWLSWADGAMRARLDAERDVSPDAYFGRLEGMAHVAAHSHERSWEVLVALEGAGTFVLDGKEERLLAPRVVVVPPGSTHAWRPDRGVRLRAVQLYAPPGPEQRFRALAGDAGAPRL